MSGQIAVELPTAASGGSRMGETAGECAAVFCCCPCTMIHLVIIAVYRLPIGLWRKNKRRRLLRKKRKNLEKENNQRKKNDGDDGDDWSVRVRVKNDAVDGENEMMDRFHGAGFWRSGSQRTDDDY